MFDPSLITNLGVSGFALWVLWKMSQEFVKRSAEKDKAQAEEREKFAVRYEKVENDIRQNLSAIIVENTSVLKQVLEVLNGKKTKRK